MAATADPTLDALDERLDRLEGKLDALTDSLSSLAVFSQRATLIGDAAGDGAAWAWSEAEARGVDPLQSGLQGLELLLRASGPKQMALAGVLLDAADEVNPEDLRRVLASSAALLGNPHLHALLDASPQVLELVGPATTAVVEVRQQPVTAVGPFGVFGALMDEGVKKATGFALAVARKVGAGL